MEMTKNYSTLKIFLKKQNVVFGCSY